MNNDFINKINAYKNAQVNLSKVQQIILLYSGIIKHIKQAWQSAVDENFEAKFNSLDKAASIVLGLQGSLDFDKGGEISKLLDNFYHSLYFRIMSMHSKIDDNLVDQVVNEIKVMKESWEEVEKKQYDPLSINKTANLPVEENNDKKDKLTG